MIQIKKTYSINLIWARNIQKILIVNVKQMVKVAALHDKQAQRGGKCIVLHILKPHARRVLVVSPTRF